MSDVPQGEQGFEYFVGISEDDRLILDFRGRPIDHLILNVDQGLELAQAIAETCREIASGARGRMLPVNFNPIIKP